MVEFKLKSRNFNWIEILLCEINEKEILNKHFSVHERWNRKFFFHPFGSFTAFDNKHLIDKELQTKILYFDLFKVNTVRWSPSNQSKALFQFQFHNSVVWFMFVYAKKTTIIKYTTIKIVLLPWIHKTKLKTFFLNYFRKCNTNRTRLEVTKKNVIIDFDSELEVSSLLYVDACVI